jgi:hypothetical protein
MPPTNAPATATIKTMPLATSAHVHNKGIECHRVKCNERRVSDGTRWKVQRHLAFQTKNKGLFNCLRYSHTTAKFQTDGQKLRMTGLQVCSSPSCYYCARPQIKKLSKELKLVLDYAVMQGRFNYFLTQTHNKSPSISLNDKTTRAGHSFIRKTIKSIEQQNSIKLIHFSVVERTYSNPDDFTYTPEGPVCTSHSHLHSLISFPFEIDKKKRLSFLKRIIEAFNRGVKSVGGWTATKDQDLENLSEIHRRKTIDLKIIDDSTMSNGNVASYLGKIITGRADYKLADELSHHQTKKGFGRSFISLLDDIVKYDRKEDKRAWKETINAVYRKRHCFKNNTYRQILKDALLREEELAYNYAKSIVDKITDFKDLHPVIQKQVINNEMKEFIMGKPKEKFNATAEIDVPQEIYNTIGYYQFNQVLFDLIVLAGQGKFLNEFRLLKRFIKNNPTFYNGLRSIKHKPTLELLSILKDVEAKMEAFNFRLHYETDNQDD